jgi:hypothetical protein
MSGKEFHEMVKTYLKDNSWLRNNSDHLLNRFMVSGCFWSRQYCEGGDITYYPVSNWKRICRAWCATERSKQRARIAKKELNEELQKLISTGDVIRRGNRYFASEFA